MCFKRVGGRAAGQCLNHRGFHLEISAVFEKAANFAEHTGSFFEEVHHLFVGNQVELTLTVAGFDILQAVEFFRRRQQRFAQQRPFADSDGLFLGAGNKGFAGHPDDVAEIEQFEGGKILLADQIFFHHQLEFGGAVGNVCKGHFSHFTHGHNAAAGFDLLAFLKIRMKLFERGGAVEGFAVGGKTRFSQFFHVFDALLAIFIILHNFS